MMDLVVHDVDESGDFDSSVDRVLVGGLTSDKKWAGTVFVIDLTLASRPHIRKLTMYLESNLNGIFHK